VIIGWDVAVATMSKGEKAVLTCAPSYAYGDRGAGGGVVPPGATLEFEVELVGWKNLTGGAGIIYPSITDLLLLAGIVFLGLVCNRFGVFKPGGIFSEILAKLGFASTPTSTCADGSSA
jgi:hypothetical protein